MYSNFKIDLAKSTNTTYYPALNLKNKELVLKLFQSSWPLKKIDRKTKRNFKQRHLTLPRTPILKPRPAVN
jgi:hypothetical protein